MATDIEEQVEDTTAVDEGDVGASEPDKKPEGWDRERQRADQAEANVRKLIGERDMQATEAKERDDKIAELEKMVASQKATEELDAIDADMATAADLMPTLKKQAEELAKLRIEQAEAKEAHAKEKQEKESAAAEERVLTRFDKKYGAKFRNDAVALANKKVGERGSPIYDQADAVFLLDEAYSELAKGGESKTKTKNTVAVDTGAGGGVVGPGGPNSGSLEDVMSSMRKDGKFRGDLPTSD